MIGVLHSLRKFFGTLFSPLAFPNPKPLSSYDLSLPPRPPTFLPKPSEGVRGGILGAPSSSFPLCSSPSPDSRSHCRFGALDFTLSPGTLYDVLGVAAATSGLEIVVAYCRLAGACHPDAVVAADRLTSSCGSTRPTRRSPTRTSAPSIIEGSSSPIGDGGRSILPDRHIPSTPAGASRGRGRWISAARSPRPAGFPPLLLRDLALFRSGRCCPDVADPHSHLCQTRSRQGRSLVLGRSIALVAIRPPSGAVEATLPPGDAVAGGRINTGGARAYSSSHWRIGAEQRLLPLGLSLHHIMVLTDSGFDQYHSSMIHNSGDLVSTVNPSGHVQPVVTMNLGFLSPLFVPDQLQMGGESPFFSTANFGFVNQRGRSPVLGRSIDSVAIRPPSGAVEATLPPGDVVARGRINTGGARAYSPSHWRIRAEQRRLPSGLSLHQIMVLTDSGFDQYHSSMIHNSGDLVSTVNPSGHVQPVVTMNLGFLSPLFVPDQLQMGGESPFFSIANFGFVNQWDPCIEKSGLWFHLKILPCPLLALAIYLEVVSVLPYIRSTTDAKHNVQ
ncbi:hypothetical protein ZIOFF_009939 [Zingiber officinale]|uniref:Uncharacterized protein n=1 Tax=Zingiber officinale TaxID=94328 RepID=A0A8J5LZ08_ZINOF|nr:hypothetical protein ZIOFF_009939 [Zingiber officinale]